MGGILVYQQLRALIDEGAIAIEVDRPPEAIVAAVCRHLRKPAP